MSKKKALGQDPLAWIKLTQESEEKRKLEAEAPPGVEDGAPSPPAAGGMNWSFLIVYIINMAVLLVLVFLIYTDLASSLDDMTEHVTRLELRVQAMERIAPAPIAAETLRRDLPESDDMPAE